MKKVLLGYSTVVAILLVYIPLNGMEKVRSLATQFKQKGTQVLTHAQQTKVWNMIAQKSAQLKNCYAIEQCSKAKIAALTIAVIIGLTVLGFGLEFSAIKANEKYGVPTLVVTPPYYFGKVLEVPVAFPVAVGKQIKKRAGPFRGQLVNYQEELYKVVGYPLYPGFKTNFPIRSLFSSTIRIRKPKGGVIEVPIEEVTPLKP